MASKGALSSLWLFVMLVAFKLALADPIPEICSPNYAKLPTREEIENTYLEVLSMFEHNQELHELIDQSYEAFKMEIATAIAEKSEKIREMHNIRVCTMFHMIDSLIRNNEYDNLVPT